MPRTACCVVVLLLLVGCGSPTSEILTTRLVDAFGSAEISGTPEQVTAPERTEWRFEDADHGWKVANGVASLAVSDGRLQGTSTDDLPIVHVERASGLDETDVLEQVVVRARVSAGSNLAVSFSGSEELNMERTVERARDFPWQLSSPLVTGDELQTYTIRTAASARTSYPASGIRHVLLRPSDEQGAEFEIESVRLVFRREHLASIPAGVSWQGLSEIYRESIVARSPEQIRFALSLPDEPMLDLALGTVEESPVTFRVTAELSSSERQVLLERTLSTPNRWQEVPLDLAELGGRDVTLALELNADEPGSIGLWGAPAIRRQRVAAGPESPRGVVVILVDTLRSDHLEAYGYERTTAPALGKMAREGILFADAIAQGAWTKVSVPSMMSSTYPTSNGIYEMAQKLPASADTLAEAFRDAGYATWAGSANGFSGRANNLHQGYEVMHERSSLVIPEGHPRSKTARMLNDRLLPWLESHRDVPFFVFFHPIDPHSPYEPYRPYDTMWGRADGKARYEEWREKANPVVREHRRNGNLPHREDLAEVGIDPDEFNQLTIDWYDGSIRAADVEVRRLMEKLQELDLADDTLVVFLSDHGEEFFDHGGGFHEDNVYGELVNVPLVFRWPAALPGDTVVDETVEMLDVAPTLLQLAGIDVPERMQGDSLVALLRAGESEERWSDQPAISEWMRRTDQRPRGGVDSHSIILGGYKLVRNFERSDESVPEFELYDHRQDPLDQVNIASANREIVERLAQQLEGWHRWALDRTLPSDAEEADGLDAEELERLRSLGYLN